jgi:hypothetical protein
MSVFDVLNSSTVTITKNVPTQDMLGGPIADYEVQEADIDAQVEYHRDKLFGNEIDAFGQSLTMSQRDVWLDGEFTYLGENGNGFGVLFDDGSFGRITSIERDLPLESLPVSTMLVVKIMGVQPE